MYLFRTFFELFPISVHQKYVCDTIYGNKMSLHPQLKYLLQGIFDTFTTHYMFWGLTKQFLKLVKTYLSLFKEVKSQKQLCLVELAPPRSNHCTTTEVLCPRLKHTSTVLMMMMTVKKTGEQRHCPAQIENTNHCWLHPAYAITTVQRKDGGQLHRSPCNPAAVT